jgi:N-acetylglucosaminyldiphosphoundecaprenol N-acetyl-beta-D-mannosaminyltransferase
LTPVSDTPPQHASVWPDKVDLLGIGLTPTTYSEATATIIDVARRNQPGVVGCHAVHSVVVCSGNRDLRNKVNQFDMITPDGQPVRWGLNLLYGVGLRERVYGPELMLRLCQQAAIEGVSVYFYGASEMVVERLAENLARKYPELQITGYESPPFRALTAEEDREVVSRINHSGAGIVFIGLGCPKQDEFAFDHRHSIRAVQVCVGAAFDFHAGAKRIAPDWMQRHGLEWLFRLFQEPGRLWRRYLITNTVFITKLAFTLLNVRGVRKKRYQWRQQQEKS